MSFDYFTASCINAALMLIWPVAEAVGLLSRNWSPRNLPRWRIFPILQEELLQCTILRLSWTLLQKRKF